MNKIIWFIILGIFFFYSDTINIVIFAHNFDTDDNSSFLTLINKILIENRLLNDSLSDINYNNLNSLEYTKNIEKILDDILISEDSFNIDSDQFYNNTIIALVVANLADEVLRNYGYAFGVPSNIMLSMNFSKIAKMQNISNSAMDMSTHFNHSRDLENMTAMIDKSNYLNAIRISDRMIELYNGELKGVSSNSIDDRAKSRLVDALLNLKKDLEIKVSPYKIMEDVHGEIHPNLQIAFNLTLKR
jgi:hypothetical protein